jgi:hypothetical protein
MTLSEEEMSGWELDLLESGDPGPRVSPGACAMITLIFFWLILVSLLSVHGYLLAGCRKVLLYGLSDLLLLPLTDCRLRSTVF